ncbi:PREDICTED: transmembrane channel-like protein 5 [Nanorana parkeri]|uniref:transmembrane channel-like protein 5 n=1 Tax=Nanorana parkeri TaxID=125878 RepID=UPI000853F701|nr:PREDICTED: transmembrane channel-like protein 5 [Nanorana parkeri]
MASNYNDGFYNSAYHDSETLEIDRGLQGKPSSRPLTRLSSRQNSSYPYEDDIDNHDNSFPKERNWRGDQGFLPRNAQQMDTDYNVQIPRYSTSEEDTHALGHYNPSFQSDQGPSYIDIDKDTDDAIDVSDGGLRNRSKLQTALAAQYMRPSNIASLDPVLERHIENSNKQEKEKLIANLVEQSNSEIAKEIQKFPTCLNEKRDLRNQVMKIKQKSLKDTSKMNCCTGYLKSIKLSFRRFREAASDAFEILQLWHSTLKVIEGTFGSSILSYFVFLKWLLLFNIFSFVVNFSFITIPQFVDMPPNNLSFSGLELLTGAGYFEKTVLYYGFYTNATIRKEANLAPYNMQLAYIFTIGLYLSTCFLILLFSMAKSFKKNFINPASYTGNTAKLLCSWDFSINNEKAVILKKKHLSTQIKETLSEKLLKKLTLSTSQKLARLAIHLAAWIVSIGLAVGCCAGVYFLCVQVGASTQDTNLNDLTKQAATLLVPVVVSLINLIMPLVYALFGLVEKFKYPHHEIYVVIIRNILLKISIIGILCYYWLQKVAESNFECWESYVGQDIYRLVVIDFLFVLFGSFFGEFLRRIFGTYCCKKLGMPEFDIARNVLDLIYAQTLAWIGIFFSPLLPLIQMIKLFIIFYVKKVSLIMNCTPPRRAWRASQMTTVFIFLLFFPSFAGVLSVIGVTVWRRVPSKTCGPFRNLLSPYESIDIWIHQIDFFENSKWVVWIYRNLVESVLFFYILTMIVLIISYLNWQIVLGRKIMVKHLYKQIANEGQDKYFLIHELRKTQKPNVADYGAPQKMPVRQIQPVHEAQDIQLADEPKPQFPQSNRSSSALALAMRARQQADLEEDSPPMNRKAPRNSSIMAQIEMAGQEAEGDMDQPGYNTGPSNAMEMVMRARQQAEYEEQQPNYGADAMAMRARPMENKRMQQRWS